MGGIEGMVSAWRYTVMPPNMPKVSRRRVVAMIGSGILEAEKFGEKVWMIDAESVKKRQGKMKGKKNED